MTETTCIGDEGEYLKHKDASLLSIPCKVYGRVVSVKVVVCSEHLTRVEHCGLRRVKGCLD